MSQKLLVGSDNVIRLDELTNSLTGEYVNSATVAVVVRDPEDVEVATLSLDYVAGSDGSYAGTLDMEAEDGEEYTAVITATSGDLQLVLNLPLVFEDADDSDMDWSSKQELIDMFGNTNITQWADLDNNNDADDIARRIRWAIHEATEDVKGRLVDSPVKLSTLSPVPAPLRAATTRLAGVALYESRGLHDTSDEDGKNRLKTHRDQAYKYLAKIQAGQIRVGEGASSTPQVGTWEESTEEFDVRSLD